jgi:hypothetical protein
VYHFFLAIRADRDFFFSPHFIVTPAFRTVTVFNSVLIGGMCDDKGHLFCFVKNNKRGARLEIPHTKREKFLPFDYFTD